MSLTETPPKEPHKLLLEKLRQSYAREQAELISPSSLRKLRGAADLTQEDLASKLNRLNGTKFVQTDISRLERSDLGYIDRSLQLATSRYFRSIGYDVDGTGALIYIPPAT